VAVELINDAGKAEWTFPIVPTRHKLLDYIQYLHTDVDSLFDDLMGEKDD
jgi:hypothetical protein